MKNNTEDEKIIGMYTKYLEEKFFKKVPNLITCKEKSQDIESHAVQFTGKDHNIYGIENFAKPLYRLFKINKTEFCYFSLKVTTNNFKFFTYRIIAGDWIVFEPKVKQTPLRIVSDKEFETNYEVVL
jgi:hypothetical protein